MFPNGWPGRGLLLLRAGTGLLLVRDGICILASPLHQHADGLTMVASLTGLFLLLGLWTPIVGMLLAGLSLTLLTFQHEDPRILFLHAMIGVALALLGPGVWSIDAAMFGRKRIDLPKD